MLNQRVCDTVNVIANCLTFSVIIKLGHIKRCDLSMWFCWSTTVCKSRTRRVRNRCATGIHPARHLMCWSDRRMMICGAIKQRSRPKQLADFYCLRLASKSRRKR